MNGFYYYLIEANKCLDDYVELSEYQSIFEASTSDEIAEIDANNEKITKKSESLFRKALNVIKELLKKIKDSISNFFDYLGLTSNEKSLYNKFKKAIKENPEFGRKTVTVKVYQNIEKSYGNAIKRAEQEYDRYKKEESENRPDLMKIIMDDAKSGVKTVTKTVTLNALLHMIKDNVNQANLIKSAIKSDERVMDYLEKQFGKEGAKKIKKTANSRTSLLGWRHMIAKLRHDESKCLIDSVTASLTDVKGLVLSGAAVAPDMAKDIVGVGVTSAKLGLKSPVGRKIDTYNPISRIKNYYGNKKINKTLGDIDATGRSIAQSAHKIGSVFNRNKNVNESVIYTITEECDYDDEFIDSLF